MAAGGGGVGVGRKLFVIMPMELHSSGNRWDR